MVTHWSVGDGTENHRSMPLIWAVTILTCVIIVDVRFVVLLLSITITVRVGCVVLLITRVINVSMFRLKCLISTFCKD
jgi:hypothetical protein